MIYMAMAIRHHYILSNWILSMSYPISIYIYIYISPLRNSTCIEYAWRIGELPISKAVAAGPEIRMGDCGDMADCLNMSDSTSSFLSSAWRSKSTSLIPGLLIMLPGTKVTWLRLFTKYAPQSASNSDTDSGGIESLSFRDPDRVVLDIFAESKDGTLLSVMKSTISSCRSNLGSSRFWSLLLVADVLCAHGMRNIMIAPDNIGIPAMWNARL